MSNIHLELLHLAQDKNSDANPSYLLEQGANPNARDPFHHKWTPLHYAVFLNKENFALQLLQHPRTNAQLLDSDGFSPLYWAAKKSTPAVIKALLSKGCDPNERDMHGMTALFAAVSANNPENVEALLAHPTINVNQPNQFGGSALHHTAFATDSVEIAELLVKAGANLFLYDYEDQAPLHVAKRRKRKKLFQYFRSKMKEEEPSWKCDIDTSGWDSLTEDTDTLSEPSMDAADMLYPPIPIAIPALDKENEMKQPAAVRERINDSLQRPKLNSLSPPASVTRHASVSPVNEAQHVDESNAFILPPHDSLQLPPSANSSNAKLDMNAVSMQSNCSHFSQQSSNSSNDEANHNAATHALKANSNQSARLTPTHKPSSHSLPPHDHRSKHHQSQTPILTHSSTPKIQSQSQSQKKQSSGHRDSAPPRSPSPSSHSQHAWHKQQQQRMKQVQESKLRMALKIEQSNLSKEARDLLQEQQYHFEFEQRFFYDTMMHEYEHLRFQLKHQNEVIKQLLAESNQFKVALSYYKNDGRASSTTPRVEASNVNITKKRSNQTPSSKSSKQRKEFRKWFKREIGDEFMAEYFELFVHAGFDDLTSLMHIHNEQDLVNLGITKTGHIRKIFAVIESYQLQNTQDIAPPALHPSASSPVNKSVAQQQGQLNDLQYYNNYDEGTLRTE